MAEYVQFRTEETIPELEQMERIKLFDKNEIRAIANRRKEFEYKTQRQTKSKEDYLRYIQYEMDLLKLIRVRRHKRRTHYKRSEIEHAITNRIDKLFKHAIQRFQSDVKLWISHIKFCTQVGFTVAVGSIFVRLLAVHCDKPNLWKLAANWEFDQNNSIENARKFLLRALRFHPDSKVIYKEAFHMELKYAEQERDLKAEKEEERRQYSLPEDVKTEEVLDPILEGRLAEVIYDSAVAKIPGPDFCVDLLNVAAKYDFTDGLQNKIMNHLMTAYRNDELVWDLLAKRAFAGFIPPELDDETTPNLFTLRTNMTRKEQIQACVDVYMSALEAVNTQRMWTYYLDLLIELNEDLTSLSKLKQKLLRTGFVKAHDAGLLNEQFYLHWVDQLCSKGYTDKVMGVLETATGRYPLNADLWHRYLCCHLKGNCETSGLAVFERALLELGTQTDASLQLWKELVQYYQPRDEEKAGDVFERAVGLGTDISLALKPVYLDWLHLTRGIEAARSKYSKMCLVPPLSLELHKKMVELECSQSEVDVKCARKCYDEACHQFGKDNDGGLWLEYIKFELEKGEPKFVSRVYEKAMKTLNAGEVESFVTKFTLLKSGTSTPMVIS